METHDIHNYPSPEEAAFPENGETSHSATPANSTHAFEPPRIPVRLPHVVQFAEGSLYYDTNTLRRSLRWCSRLRNTPGWAVA